MKKSILILFLAFIFSFTNLSAQNPDEVALYKEQLEQDRVKKNEQFRDPSTSPLQTSDLDSFESLSYFEPDMSFKVTAELDLLDEPLEVTLNTSDGEKTDLTKYGTLSFKLNGKVYTLSVFKGKNMPELNGTPDMYFIPFTDKTTGKETNKNGRYIAINLPEEGTLVELDFNRAMNPYSAYNSVYSSVIPPNENQLEAVVMTGERKYEDR